MSGTPGERLALGRRKATLPQSLSELQRKLGCNDDELTFDGARRSAQQRA